MILTDSNNLPIGYISCYGQILLHHCSMVFEIQEFFIKKEYRNQQLGTQLLLALENRLKEINISFLEVSANNIRLQTHRFYEKNGFKETHKKFFKQIL